MIPPLVRLPATTLDHDGLDALARLVEVVAPGRSVIVGPPRSATGHELDAFVIAAWISKRCPDTAIGVAARVAAGRQASMVAREATTAELLGACGVLLLEGDASDCRDAALIIGALFTEGVHTVTTPTAIVVGARNLPQPDVAGGPPVRWQEGAALVRLVDGEPAVCGSVVECHADEAWPAPEPGVLVVIEHPLGAPDALTEALAR